MLEIRNLLKTYKTKGGAEVRALDGVSLCFEEKGMVFLLGKSGSGKSTLLNLCGGLDTPDSGEIVIKGKSSKDFSQADFDSYRNTFIGFVFQEYNILNEFTVEDNIALALELQVISVLPFFLLTAGAEYGKISEDEKLRVGCPQPKREVHRGQEQSSGI